MNLNVQTFKFSKYTIYTMKSTRHAKYNINYHFVWIPKYRRPILSNIKEELEIVLKDIAKSKGLEILNLNSTRSLTSG